MNPPPMTTIVGAGPAGLAAAITLARGGWRVVVHEARAAVGERFGRDYQGLENWTDRVDVLEWMQGLGLTTGFRVLPCSTGTAFDAWGDAYRVQSSAPLFYMVERGPVVGSLDRALLAQAQSLGVEVRFNSRLDHLAGPGVLAVGPRAADAIAVGYHFATDMSDGFWAICDDNLAPQGYAYLLVMGGRGTVKSCMFTGFKQEREYVQRTVEAFERLVGLRMRDIQPHGGVGNLRLPITGMSGEHPVVGEQAGFQDALWGFGMRYALASGVLAARSLLSGEDYDHAWRRAFGAGLSMSLINRAIHARIGNRGYRWLLGMQESHGDARVFLRRLYRPSVAKRLLLPWARWRYRSKRQDQSCDHIGCECIWCRMGEHA